MAIAMGLVSAAHSTSEFPFALQLRGVRSVYLSVNNSSGWSEIGEALAVIQPQIETKLRASGIQVLTEAQWEASPATPVLDVSVRTAKTSGTLNALTLSGGPDSELAGTSSAFVFLVSVRFSQQVQVAAKAGEPFFATTWSWEGWLGAEQRRPFKMIRADVLRGLDFFISAVLSVREAP